MRCGKPILSRGLVGEGETCVGPAGATCAIWAVTELKSGQGERICPAVHGPQPPCLLGPRAMHRFPFVSLELYTLDFAFLFISYCALNYRFHRPHPSRQNPRAGLFATHVSAPVLDVFLHFQCYLRCPYDASQSQNQIAIA